MEPWLAFPITIGLPPDSLYPHLTSPAMSFDSVPQLGLGTAVLIIFALCASFVVIRGITRLIIGTFALGISAWITFLVWQQAPALSLQVMGKSLPWFITGLPILAFFATFFIIRKLTKILLGPITRADGDSGHPSFFGTALRIVFAIVPTVLVTVIGAALIHYNGSIAEIRESSKKPDGAASSSFSTISQGLKSAVTSVFPAGWLTAVDPLADPSRIDLAKLITARAAGPRPAVIDPATGKPYPRAAIVDDPELQNLARQGNFAALLRHPLLTQALEDPKIKKIVEDLSQ